MENARFRIRKSWGCIVGRGISGTAESYVTSDGRNGPPKEFTYEEVVAYLEANSDPSKGVYMDAELIWERSRPEA